MMVKSQDQKLSATKGVGGRRLCGLRIERGRENGRGKEEKAECIYRVWVLENPLCFFFFWFMFFFFKYCADVENCGSFKSFGYIYIYIYIYIEREREREREREIRLTKPK